MMAKMSAMCKVALLSHPDDVGAAMAFLNRDVCDAGLEFGLVTLLLCVIDPSCHEIHVANAGHISPMFLRKDRNIDETVGADARGFPLGFDHQTEYPTDRTLVAPGESVVLFSDGISEAMNADNELYSTDRIRRKLAAMTTAGPEEFGRALLDDVSQYTAGGKQHDDMTIVVFRRNPPQPG
jgi:serine phosphatase RsbU (regulator of sigma subunit)